MRSLSVQLLDPQDMCQRQVLVALEKIAVAGRFVRHNDPRRQHEGFVGMMDVVRLPFGRVDSKRPKRALPKEIPNVMRAHLTASPEFPEEFIY
jgi:hypothetical protein